MTPVRHRPRPRHVAIRMATAGALLSASVTGCAVHVPEVTAHTQPPPPQLAAAAYLDSLDKPGTDEDLPRWLCEQNRAALLRQRQTLLDDIAENLRPTHPMIQFRHRAMAGTGADGSPPSEDPAQSHITIEVPVEVIATGVDQRGKPVTFQSPRLSWRFTLTRLTGEWRICQIDRPDWCNQYQDC